MTPSLVKRTGGRIRASPGLAAHVNTVDSSDIRKGVAPGSASFRVINPVLAEGATPLERKVAQCC